MRYLYTFIFLLCVSGFAENTMAQSINFEDGFEDGDFTNSPAWNGETGDFAVVEDEPNFLLQLDATGTSPSYLSTPSSNVEGYWEFYIEFRGFEPSGSNQAEIFLMSDNANLEGAVNGYAIQVGETGDDLFRLVRYDNGSEVATVITGTTVVQSGGGYTIRVNRDNSGNWQMQVAEGYGLTSATSHTGTDNTHTAASHFGTKINFTSSRSDLFYLDFKIDLPPFVATNVRLSDTNTVDVSFNRAPDQTTVESSDFFVNNGIGSPTSVVFPAPDTARLNYSPALPANQYLLSVNELSDQFGNTVDSDSLTFFVFDNFTTGDVKINEIMSDPPSGQAEYIELVNTTDKYLNLANWEIGDDGSTETMTSDPIPLQPNGFRVISADTTALFNAYGSRNYHLFTKLATLNNGSDAVQLITDNGTQADSLFYTTDWGGTDVALERRSTSAASIYSENWGDSPNSLGGTPGQPNEISTDDTPPFFEELYAIDPTTLQLVFSERITASSATDPQNYQISPGKNIQLISARNDSVTLYLSSELTSETTYEVTATDISDIFGNTLSGATKKFEFLKIDSAYPGDIVINEILYNPGSEGRVDFIEIYNTTSKNFDISNWQIADGSSKATLPQNIQLPANSYLVLTGGDRFASTINNALDVDDFPSYNNNSGDDVYLETDNGRTIDSLRYATSWGGSEEGTSLERKDPEAASNDASNWQTSGTGSAGSQNINFQEDTTPPVVIFSKVLPNGQIEVRFNEFIQLTPDLKFSADNKQLQIASFDSTRGNVIFLSGGSSKSQNGIASESTITVENLSDVKGNTTESTEVAVAQPMQPSNLVINEIMFNPLDKPDDNRPDQSEYIELRNTQDYAISLEGLVLHDAPDEEGDTRNLLPVTSTAKWVPPQGQVLVHADPVISFKDSKVAQFFDLATTDMHSIMRVDRSSLSLASSGDAIFIADSTGATIDSVFYGESWHNPNIIDTRGVALERVSPGGPSDDETNWGSSVNARGGTPNSENSIYQENTRQPQDTGISFKPNPFSPDGDGYQDNLFINYKLDQQDYLIDVHIYDRYGRMVRELADGKQAGLQGQLIWNGRKDDGGRNRIGIYIVVFEAYDSASGDRKSFKKTVVLARRVN